MQRFTLRLPDDLLQRLRRYARQHLISKAHIVRRILSLLPWDDDGRVLIVLAVRKADASQPERLKAAIMEAAETVVNSGVLG